MCRTLNVLYDNSKFTIAQSQEEPITKIDEDYAITLTLSQVSDIKARTGKFVEKIIEL